MIKHVIFILVFLYVSGSRCYMVNATLKNNVFQDVTSRILRHKRQVLCQDGEYTYPGRTNSCCRCAAGQFLKEHCKDRKDDGKCEYCDAGNTYNDLPNAQPTCKPCTSCSHPNAHLEVKELCTIAKDTVCRCTAGHYCDNEACTHCQRCQTCADDGIKVSCSTNNNTICNDKKGLTGWNLAIISVIVILLVIMGIAGAVYFRRKKYSQPNQTITTVVSPQEMQPCIETDVNSEPLLPDISRVLGWKLTKEIAIKGGIPKATIESHQLNHPHDVEEQTHSLLHAWVEKQGSNALGKLIRVLRDMGQTNAANKVEAIITEANP